MIERAVKMEFTPGENKAEIPCLGLIQISDDAEGRFYLTTQNGQCTAVDLQDVLRAIQDAVLVARR